VEAGGIEPPIRNTGHGVKSCCGQIVTIFHPEPGPGRFSMSDCCTSIARQPEPDLHTVVLFSVASLCCIS